MTSGGLDGYLGPQAQDFSNLPQHIEEAVNNDPPPDICGGVNEDEAVCQIAVAEKRYRAARMH